MGSFSNKLKPKPAHNRIVYASALKRLGLRSARSPKGSHASLRHIFAVAETLRVSLSQPQKRHIQPKRYVQVLLKYRFLCLNV